MIERKIHFKNFFLLCLALLLIMGKAFADDSIKIIGFSASETKNVNVSFVLTGKANYKVFYLGKPSRVVIDVQNTVFATKIYHKMLAKTLLRNIRLGKHPGKLRIVLDLPSKLRFTHALTWDQKSRRFILTITLIRKNISSKLIETKAKVTVIAKTNKTAIKTNKNVTTQKKHVVFRKILSVKTIEKSTKKLVANKHKNISLNISILPEGVDLTAGIESLKFKDLYVTAGLNLAPGVYHSHVVLEKHLPHGPSKFVHMPIVPAYAKNNLRIRSKRGFQDQRYKSQFMRDVVIVIDPGHGGKDPGVTGVSGIREKDVVFVIAKYLQQYLNQTMGFKAVLTRSGDDFMYLRERLKVAHNNSADMFISLHADAYSGKYPYRGGASIFALSRIGATSAAARWLAARENESELGQLVNDHSMELRSLLINLEQKATIKCSLQIGKSILQQLGAVTHLHQRKVDQAAFVVLRSPDIPSLLVETGFLSDSNEAHKLANVDYDKKLAYALALGIKQYFGQNPPQNSYLAAMRQQNIGDYRRQNTLGAVLRN